MISDFLMHMYINNLILVFLYIKIKKKSETVEYPCLTSNITRINSVIHFTQNTAHIRVNQSQTELYWGC